MMAGWKTAQKKLNCSAATTQNIYEKKYEKVYYKYYNQ